MDGGGGGSPTQTARLYRKALKTLSSWVIDRNIFLDEATELRARFDANRGCDAAKAVRLLRVSKQLLTIMLLMGSDSSYETLRCYSHFFHRLF